MPVWQNKSSTRSCGSAGCGHSSRISLKDRKSTRLNSSHTVISYAVFCLKKKKKSINDSTDIENAVFPKQMPIRITARDCDMMPTFMVIKDDATVLCTLRKSSRRISGCDY